MTLAAGGGRPPSPSRRTRDRRPGPPTERDRRRSTPMRGVAPGRGSWSACGWWCAGLRRLVLYLVEPLFQQRTQHELLTQLSSRRSPTPTTSSPGAGQPTPAPSRPISVHPVGILEIPGLHLRQVVVEGVGSAADRRRARATCPAPPPSASRATRAVVGRRSTYGGPFQLVVDTCTPGDRILVTTTQGQTVYSVASVHAGDDHHAAPSSSLGQLGGGDGVPRPTPSSTSRPARWPRPAASRLDRRSISSTAPPRRTSSRWSPRRAALALEQLERDRGGGHHEDRALRARPPRTVAPPSRPA